MLYTLSFPKHFKVFDPFPFYYLYVQAFQISWGKTLLEFFIQSSLNRLS